MSSFTISKKLFLLPSIFEYVFLSRIHYVLLLAHQPNINIQEDNNSLLLLNGNIYEMYTMELRFQVKV